jgi:light-regulated signal transduction histidine kinase (bacteriophytochrome)
MENLLGNAWKFTSRRPAAEIRVTGEERADEVVCTVRDDGVGFDMAYAKNLFGAFERLHAVRDFPGNGVGLATVQRIVHRHGGRVWAEAAPGRGAAFSFSLPRASRAEAA